MVQIHVYILSILCFFFSRATLKMEGRTKKFGTILAFKLSMSTDILPAYKKRVKHDQTIIGDSIIRWFLDRKMDLQSSQAGFVCISVSHTGNQHIPSQSPFEDDVPFPKVGHSVRSLLIVAVYPGAFSGQHFGCTLDHVQIPAGLCDKRGAKRWIGRFIGPIQGEEIKPQTPPYYWRFRNLATQGMYLNNMWKF